MVFIMKMVELFGLACLRIFSAIVGVFDVTGAKELVSAAEQAAAERKALRQSERDAIARLHPDDRALMWFADGKITQARAAKRKFWKESDPLPYAKLYQKLGLSEDELNYTMTVEERMPGYFQNKVRAALLSLK